MQGHGRYELPQQDAVDVAWRELRLLKTVSRFGNKGTLADAIDERERGRRYEEEDTTAGGGDVHIVIKTCRWTTLFLWLCVTLHFFQLLVDDKP